MDLLVQLVAALVAGLLLTLFVAMIWSSASQLRDAWRNSTEGRR